MANENQTTNDSFWDRVEGATNTSASTASADKPTNSADPGQSVAHGFWDRVEGKKTSMGADVKYRRPAGQSKNRCRSAASLGISGSRCNGESG